MRDSLRHQLILDKAVEAFFKETGLVLRGVESANLEHSGEVLWIDMLGFEQGFCVCVHPSITLQNLNVVIYQSQELDSLYPKLIVAEHVNATQAERLKEARIQFIDTCGNAYLHQPPLHIFVKGNKPAKNPFVSKAGRAFQLSGLKVIFALLQNADLVNQTYREIAEQAGVALGGVGEILMDLVNQGYLEKMNKQTRRLVNKDKLLQRWVEHYPKLFQRYHLGTFTTQDPNWWQGMNAQALEVFWGGEIAAQVYTNYLQAKEGVVFVSKDKMAELIKAARLKKRPDNDLEAIRIELVEPFWQPDLAQLNSGLAPPILVYADLITSGDVRNLETAQRIYDQFIG
jgi:hypothetical protein